VLELRQARAQATPLRSAADAAAEKTAVARTAVEAAQGAALSEAKILTGATVAVGLVGAMFAGSAPGFDDADD
jgi:hypothetical protein